VGQDAPSGENVQKDEDLQEREDTDEGLHHGTRQLDYLLFSFQYLSSNTQTRH